MSENGSSAWPGNTSTRCSIHAFRSVSRSRSDTGFERSMPVTRAPHAKPTGWMDIVDMVSPLSVGLDAGFLDDFAPLGHLRPEEGVQVLGPAESKVEILCYQPVLVL